MMGHTSTEADDTDTSKNLVEVDQGDYENENDDTRLNWCSYILRTSFKLLLLISNFIPTPLVMYLWYAMNRSVTLFLDDAGIEASNEALKILSTMFFIFMVCSTLLDSTTSDLNKTYHDFFGDNEGPDALEPIPNNTLGQINIIPMLTTSFVFSLSLEIGVLDWVDNPDDQASLQILFTIIFGALGTLDYYNLTRKKNKEHALGAKHLPAELLKLFSRRWLRWLRGANLVLTQTAYRTVLALFDIVMWGIKNTISHHYVTSKNGSWTIKLTGITSFWHTIWSRSRPVWFRFMDERLDKVTWQRLSETRIVTIKRSILILQTAIEAGAVAAITYLSGYPIIGGIAGAVYFLVAATIEVTVDRSWEVINNQDSESRPLLLMNGLEHGELNPNNYKALVDKLKASKTPRYVGLIISVMGRLCTRPIALYDFMKSMLTTILPAIGISITCPPHMFIAIYTLFAIQVGIPDTLTYCDITADFYPQLLAQFLIYYGNALERTGTRCLAVPITAYKFCAVWEREFPEGEIIVAKRYAESIP